MEKKKFFAHFSEEMDLTTGNMFLKLLAYTFPMILLSLFQLLYTSMDLIVVSNYGGGYTSMEAVGANNSLINLIIGLFVGVSVGINVVVARSVGTKNKEKAHKAIQTAMLLALGFGIAIGAFGFFASGALLKAMSTPDSILPKAEKYLQIYFLALPFLMIFNFGSAILRAMGDSKRPLYALIVSGVLNICLNFFFVLVTHLDVEGVALGTLVSEAVSALMVVYFLAHNKKAFAYLNLKEWRFYWPEGKEILKNGIPAGLQSLVFSISNVFIQSEVNKFGDIAVAGNTAASTIEGYIYIILDSFAVALVAFLAQNYGANKKENIHKIVLYSMLLVTGLGLALGGIAYWARVPLLKLFITDRAVTSQEDYALAIQMGERRLYIIGLTYFLDGLMDTSSSICRGLGHMSTPTIITFLACCVTRVVFILTAFQWVESLHTLEWLWASWPLSWVLAIASYWCFIPHYLKETDRKIEAALIPLPEPLVEKPAN